MKIKEIYEIIDDWYTVAPKYRTKKKLKELIRKGIKNENN